MLLSDRVRIQSLAGSEQTNVPVVVGDFVRLFSRRCPLLLASLMIDIVFADRDAPGVVQVMTQNYEGKRKRILGKRSVVSYKRPNYKKAIVTFASPQWVAKSSSSAS